MTYLDDQKKLSIAAGDFSKRSEDLKKTFLIWAFIAAAVFAGMFLVTGGNIVAPVAVVGGIALLVVVIEIPRSIWYIMLVGAITIETFFLNFPDSITDRIPLFWDFNSMVQVYAHKGDFHAIPLSVFECLLVLALLSWFIRAIYFDRMKFVKGELFIPILLYIMCVFGALLHGLASGGLFNIALFEVRAQFYFMMAYLLTVNTAKAPEKLISVMLWATAFSVGFKGILCTLRYIVTLKGTTIPEIGIGAHEESFFFNCFEFEFMALSLAGVQPKLRKVMLFLLPCVVIANLANERRAATASLAITLLIMLVLGAFAFPKRRKTIAITAVIIAVIAAIYLPVEWNGTNAIAQPARAIKSQFTPDPRDALSNAYRDDENINLMYTMRQSPIIGYGYGKPFLEVIQMIDLTSVDPFVHYMTHNQILWVWMRVGWIGFFFFWIMVTAIIIKGCQLLTNPATNVEVRAAALLSVLIIVMQMIFGLLDLQISCMRNMLYCGTWAGVVACLSAAYPHPGGTGFGRKRPMTHVKWNLPAEEQATP